MRQNNILNHLKEQAQKAKQSVAQTVKEIADESGLSSKEGREEILKKAKSLANKTRQSIQDTAQRGAAAAKSAVDKSIEKAQTAGSQIKESIKSKKDTDKKKPANVNEVQEPVTPKPVEPVTPKPEEIPETGSSSIDETSMPIEKTVAPKKSARKKNTTQKKSSLKGPAVLAAGLAIGGAGVGIGIGVDDADTHCAYFSLEEEYHLMDDCIRQCGNNNLSGKELYAERCAEKIRQFECHEKMSYSNADHIISYSCPISFE